jgi:D-alanyl-lipoteichoic acid acyltransferase DltB (MBOAT superfamily)
LGTLGYFKYTNFIFETINQLFGGSLPAMDIILPVGISFFTFQTWSYTLDIYYRKLEPIHSFKDFVFFVSFFPQLVAGPIVRASYFIPQIHKKVSLDQETISGAMVLIFAGLLKKGVIADYLSINFVERIFDNPSLFSGWRTSWVSMPILCRSIAISAVIRISPSALPRFWVLIFPSTSIAPTRHIALPISGVDGISRFPLG